TAAIAVFGALLLAAALIPPRPGLHRAAAGMAAALFLLMLAAAGQSATALVPLAPGLARVSLGAAFWVLIGAAGLAIIDGLQRARAGVGIQLATAGIIAGGFAI